MSKDLSLTGNFSFVSKKRLMLRNFCCCKTRIVWKTFCRLASSFMFVACAKLSLIWRCYSLCMWVFMYLCGCERVILNPHLSKDVRFVLTWSVWSSSVRPKWIPRLEFIKNVCSVYRRGLAVHPFNDRSTRNLNVWETRRLFGGWLIAIGLCIYVARIWLISGGLGLLSNVWVWNRCYV